MAALPAQCIYHLDVLIWQYTIVIRDQSCFVCGNYSSQTETDPTSRQQLAYWTCITLNRWQYRKRHRYLVVPNRHGLTKPEHLENHYSYKYRGSLPCRLSNCSKLMRGTVKTSKTSRPFIMLIEAPFSYRLPYA